MSIKGLSAVLENLSKEIIKIEEASLKGIAEAGVDIIEDTDVSAPVVPVDTGNLRESRFVVDSNGFIEYGQSPKFTNIGRSGVKSDVDVSVMYEDHSSALNDAGTKAQSVGGKAVTLGFSAYYSGKVHESVGKNFVRSNSGAKYFESSIKNKKNGIIKTVGKRMKLR
jgi:hypothetical protein